MPPLTMSSKGYFDKFISLNKKSNQEESLQIVQSTLNKGTKGRAIRNVMGRGGGVGENNHVRSSD